MPDVWPVRHCPVEELIEPFHAALESVQGEFVTCRDLNDAMEKIAALLRENSAKKVGVLDRTLSRRVAESLANSFEMIYSPSDPDVVRSDELATYDAAIVSPEYLLADTGSCFFAAPTGFDRLITYIVPLCVVVASKKMLRENLSQLWEEIQPRFGNAETVRQQESGALATGEFVMMTGPSRTADIEKVLILGVHGPKRVIVFLLENDD